MDTDAGSITLWIGLLKAGDRTAAQPLWEAYLRRLVALARARLHATSRRVADEEDVALSAEGEPPGCSSHIYRRDFFAPAAGIRTDTSSFLKVGMRGAAADPVIRMPGNGGRHRSPRPPDSRFRRAV